MHKIKLVDDQALPKEHSWALARTDAGDYLLFIKHCDLCDRVLEQAWAAYRWLTRRGQAAA